MEFPKLSEMKIILDPELEAKIIPVSNYILEVNASQNIDDLNELTQDLINFPYAVLIKLCQHNPEIETFFRTNESLANKLKQKLREVEHPDIEIKSMDGKEEYSIFDLYLAASLMYDFLNETSNISRMDALNYACALGLNDALLSRCMVNEKIIKQPDQTQERIQKAIATVMQDTNQLSNLYWGLGYLESGFILHSLGTFLLTKPTLDDKNYARTMLEQSTRKFLCASLIKDQEHSRLVMHHVTQGKGTDFLFKNSQLQLADWDDIKVTLKLWAKDRYETLESQAIKEVATAVA